MPKSITLLFACLISGLTHAQIVSGISAGYHDGQVFITWTNIPGVDTGFYYVYQNSVPISEANFSTSAYLGRVPYNFSYDYRFSYSLADSTHYFLVTNDTPFTVLDTFKNLFVTNAVADGQVNYYAVLCQYHKILPDTHIVSDSNATSQPVTEHLDPIKCYLIKTGINFPGAKGGETMDAYLHYGGNVAVGDYPEMVNEGCLPFHFGIIQSGSVGGNNATYLKFHGGNGNFINNAITAHMSNTWKISFDDWIPSYGIDSTGTNTRWLGYQEDVDIYSVTQSSPPPTSGTIRAYTFRRLRWELSWIRKHWPNTLDTSRIYLVGSSQGNGAVLLNSMVNPQLYAAANLNDPKFNVDASNDDNPGCKYNDTSSARLQTRVYWGDEDNTNLYTDIPVAPGSSEYYKIYNLVNMCYMMHYKRNASLPFIKSVSGKNDDNTCWQEKIPFFDSVQSTHAGGAYFWDLREHGGGGPDNEWPPLNIPDMQRFDIHKSYPGISYSSLDGNPGSDSVSVPPYYDGQDVGTLHGSIDFLDSSIVDSAYFWQVELLSVNAELNDGSLFPPILPEVAKADVTIKRAQQFKGFAAGTSLCWLNFHHGELVQSGTVTQLMDDTMPVPITIPQVLIFPDGGILRVVRCDSLQPMGLLMPQENFLMDEQFATLIIPPYSKQTLRSAMGLLNSNAQITTAQGQEVPLALLAADKTGRGIYYIHHYDARSSSVLKLVLL